MLQHFLRGKLDGDTLGHVGNDLYYALIVVALLVGGTMTYVRLAEIGVERRGARNLAVFCVLTSYPLGIISSRSVNVFYRPIESWSLASWWQAFVGDGTHTYHAALLLPFVAWGFYIRRSGVGAWRAWDVIMLNLPLGHAFGRLGCAFAGCCFGSDVDWQIGPLHYDYRNPVPLYELFGNLAIHTMLLHVYRRVYLGPEPGRFAGALVGGYLILYGTMRFAFEAIRTEPRVAWGLTQAQLMMSVAVSVGLVVLWQVGERARAHPTKAHAR